MDHPIYEDLDPASLPCTWWGEVPDGPHGHRIVECPVVFAKDRKELAGDSLDALRSWAARKGWHVQGDEVMCPAHAPG